MTQTMRAIHCTSYGPPEVLVLRQVPVPEPKSGQVLVRVHAATVTLGDCEVRAFRMRSWVWLMARLAIGILRPRQPVLGMEIAGEVGMGAYADFAVVPEKASLTTIPPGVSFAEAAGIPTGGLNGLHFVRKCALKPGDKVLINGAGGAIGMFATQLAKAGGAEVTAVDKKSKHAMLRTLGADHVIDYQTTDYWQTGETYDVIIDVVGLSPFGPSVAALNESGRFFLGNPGTRQMLKAIGENRKGRVKVLMQMAGEAVADLDFLKQQVAEGKLKVNVDRTYALEDIVDAHRLVEVGDKIGVVVIDVSGEAGSAAPAG